MMPPGDPNPWSDGSCCLPECSLASSDNQLQPQYCSRSARLTSQKQLPGIRPSQTLRTSTFVYTLYGSTSNITIKHRTPDIQALSESPCQGTQRRHHHMTHTDEEVQVTHTPNPCICLCMPLRVCVCRPYGTPYRVLCTAVLPRQKRRSGPKYTIHYQPTPTTLRKMFIVRGRESWQLCPAGICQPLLPGGQVTARGTGQQ